MKLVWWILWILIIVYIWVWIINNGFKNKKFKLRLSINIFILSIILVAFLYFYKDILIFFGQENLYLLQNNTWKNIWSFLIYCLSFIILLTTSFGNIKKKKSLNFIIIAILLFLWIGIWWSIMWINILVMYYIISSYAEEILKFSIWQNVFLEEKELLGKNHKKTWVDNKRQTADLIFFAIIAWLWFSVVENIFYLIVNYFSEWKVLLMTVGRSIFATLLHVVATGLIAFFVVKNKTSNKKYWLNILIWILSGFVLHAVYNLTLFYNIKILTIVILIACYFILSYLLFNSDLIYKKK